MLSLFRGLFRRPCIVRLDLRTPVRPIPRPNWVRELAPLRSAAEAARNCAEIRQAQERREEHEAALKAAVYEGQALKGLFR